MLIWGIGFDGKYQIADAVFDAVLDYHSVSREWSKIANLGFYNRVSLSCIAIYLGKPWLVLRYTPSNEWIKLKASRSTKFCWIFDRVSAVTHRV